MHSQSPPPSSPSPEPDPTPPPASASAAWDGFSLPDPAELPARALDRSVRLKEVALEVSEELLAELPEELALAAGELSIQIEARPERGRGFAPNLLGVFLGLPREDARANHSVIPPQVCLFVENLWWQSGYNIDRYREEVRLTLYHEIGHYLGLTEDDLRIRGLG